MEIVFWDFLADKITLFHIWHLIFLKNFRISEVSTEIAETRRRRDADLKDLESTTKELAVMSDAEKQRIIVQISAVQTELKRTMDER